MISYIIPSHNNLRHLKNVYDSIQRNSPESEVILLDDASTDGTWEWIQEQDVISYKSLTRVGHTILYDKGIELATNDIVGILHADMIIGPNYTENVLKHLKEGTVVCGTRIEPPLHPAGKEKIIQDFGMDFDSLDVDAFETFCIEQQVTFDGQTTKGMFAPWVIYKSDFVSMGGHDPLFAPFPFEDSDIFQRWILAGYELIQSRDAFVYHLTCRGHRWTEEIGKDDDYFQVATNKAQRNYLRKWGTWIQNDEYQHPIVPPKYDIEYKLVNASQLTLSVLEPLCDRICVDLTQEQVDDYIKLEQQNTLFDLSKKVTVNDTFDSDIIVEIDGNKLSNQTINLLQQLPHIIKDSGGIGKFKIDTFEVTIKKLNQYQNYLTTLTDKYYSEKLLT
jgi:glycosyltransferase involved in cell wall biosynthesis